MAVLSLCLRRALSLSSTLLKDRDFSALLRLLSSPHPPKPYSPLIENPSSSLTPSSKPQSDIETLICYMLGNNWAKRHYNEGAELIDSVLGCLMLSEMRHCLQENELAFDVLYCVTFKLMDHLQLEMRASYMEFNTVMKATRLRLERELLLEEIQRLEDMPSYKLLEWSFWERRLPCRNLQNRFLMQSKQELNKSTVQTNTMVLSSSLKGLQKVFQKYMHSCRKFMVSKGKVLLLRTFLLIFHLRHLPYLTYCHHSLGDTASPSGIR